ncbi:hypothetical protein Dsin_015014 [Dipteronia sinensis]|uniref:Uncharacterized protein n=1 Tax=Dipteronia sinensis TaxID=43782 RepID=A0AAE0AP39_9ROSI|nr:hypothetical protein Dsin_015014 [Dipteronia sinensis]
MGSKNCLIAWVILLLVYVLLLTSLVAARDLDPLSGQKMLQQTLGVAIHVLLLAAAGHDYTVLIVLDNKDRQSCFFY